MIEVIGFMIGYCIGSIPTAYLMVKKNNGMDITQNGSGNVGALNSYNVSNSKVIGAGVLLLDFLKGAISVWLITLMFGIDFRIEMLTLIGAVLSHCYSPWIGFKGGRGLATAAGGFLLISYPVIIIWTIIWLIAMAFRRNVHFSNFSASFLTALLSITSAEILIKYSFAPVNSELEYGFLFAVLFAIILVRHIEPIKEYLKTQNQKRLGKNDETN